MQKIMQEILFLLWIYLYKIKIQNMHFYDLTETQLIL